METYGTYNGIKFLMDGSMELSFFGAAPRKEPPAGEH